MEIATTHTNTDFDALASMVAATFLYPGAIGVLPGNIRPNVREFLSIHKELFKITPRKGFDLSDVTRLIVVDVNNWSRLDQMDALRKRKNLEIFLWDHHMQEGNIEANWKCQEETGASITLMLREMQKRDCAFAPMQATLFLMGLYEDTCNLTYSSVTALDAYMVGYLLENGADMNVASAYLSMSFDSGQTDILTKMLDNSQTCTLDGYDVGVSYIPGECGPVLLAPVVTKYKEITGVDAAFGVFCTERDRCVVIGRGGAQGIDVGSVVRKLGGGGHPGAGSAMVKSGDPDSVYRNVSDLIREMDRPQVLINEIMSEPNMCIPPHITIKEVKELSEKKGIQTFLVTDNRILLGIISGDELKKAKTESQQKAPVKAFMKKETPLVNPYRNVREATRLMAESDVGILPVVENNEVVGVVTRADLMLHIYEF